jgi:hypothetical protein
VIPENRPQQWALTEVVVVSSVLGAVACISSMILLVFSLQTNLGSSASYGFLGSVLGSNLDGLGGYFLTYHEVVTVCAAAAAAAQLPRLMQRSMLLLLPLGTPAPYVNPPRARALPRAARSCTSRSPSPTS